MFFPNRRTALTYLALLLPPLIITLLAFVTLATVDETAMAVGAPLDAMPSPTPEPLAQALVHFQEGIAQQEAGDYAAALASYQAALAIDPALAPVYGGLGSLYVALEQPQPAIASYREAARLEPDKAEWQRSLGVVLANQGQMAEGVAALERAAGLAPDDPMLHYELGQVYAFVARNQEARQAFERVVALAPGSALGGEAAEQLRLLADGP